MDNQSPMQKAFFDQMALREDRIGPNWYKREKAIAEMQNKSYLEAQKRLAAAGDVFGGLLESTGANDKNELHDKFKNYDHSLELDRVGQVGIKQQGSSHTVDDYISRPVERDGSISMEFHAPDVSIDDLLSQT